MSSTRAGSSAAGPAVGFPVGGAADGPVTKGTVRPPPRDADRGLPLLDSPGLYCDGSLGVLVGADGGNVSKRLWPRSMLGQIATVVVVSMIVIVTLGRTVENVRHSSYLDLFDVDAVIERTSAIVALLREAPTPDVQDEVLALARAADFNIDRASAADIARLEQRATPPSPLQRTIGFLFPPDRTLPRGGRTIVVDGQSIFVVPVDARLAITVQAGPSQIVTNDIVARLSYYVAAIVLLLCIFAVYSRQALLAPLARISAQVKRLNGVEDGAFRVETGSLEIRELTQALDEMRRRISDLVDARTRMLRSVSHDLRTPLTRLRQRVERLDDPRLQQTLVADIQRIDAIVEETLDYLRIDASAEGMERIDVASLLQTVQADFADMGADVSYEGPDRLVAEVKPNALLRAVTNLCDNSLKFGSHARISLAARGATFAIAVADDGPGIAADMRSEVIKPFFKVDAARGTVDRDGTSGKAGLGLGLSIVSEIVVAHGGTLTFADNEPAGLVARLDLPHCQAAPPSEPSALRRRS
jgi:signal transduction histidine kinase